jgi:hypothetical protein
MSKEQQKFSSLNAFIKPPPTEAEIKKAKDEADANRPVSPTTKGPIAGGQMPL